MARRRLTVFHRHDILERLRRGETRRKIADALGVGARTIKEVRSLARDRGWLAPEATIPTAEELETIMAEGKSAPTPTSSSVEPYRVLVEEWHRKGIEAMTIWSALQRNHGFTGSYSCVRRFVRRLLETQPDPVVRLQFEAGDVAQVDFGTGPVLYDRVTGKDRKTHMFVMTLAYSRHQYAELVWDQKVSTWLRCHRNAFEFWGGVPARVMCDNLKSAITKACRYDPEVQRSYGEFARGYGFRIDPCVARTPEHKGRVESGVRYGRRSFLQSPRTLTSLANANQQLLEWVLEEAGNRIHGTTHRVPLEMFAEEEKAALRPLPAERVEIAVWSTAKLHPDCHVVFDKAYYSAPFRYIGHKLDLRATESLVSIFVGAAMVACHARADRAGQWRTNLDHLPPEKTAYLRQTPTWCLEQAERIGEGCHEFVRQLLGDQVLERLRGAQGLLRLAKKYGPRRLEAACRRALSYENIRYRAVKSILEKGLDQAPLDEGEGGQLELPLLEAPRFARDISDLFRLN